MGFLKEFKDFAMKGNVVDLAVAFIIGGAFKTIVSSLVKDVVMPPIGMALGGVSFGQLFVNLNDQVYATLAEAEKAGAPVVKYGAFIQTIVDFLIIAFVVFCMVRLITKMQEMRKKEEEEAPEAPAEPSEDVLLLREIRDSLKK
ncbi:MAG: large conductance mechanosensitive channel protein MscL [Bdellovibrionales bacterium]|nr:large conductance mechanosensitive channel protein MscL [Bdellovibrionales bacterium]NQZ18973.1 large conductance mechanosensitive channel protein MscL [Bdellovibrionales bacterium]